MSAGTPLMADESGAKNRDTGSLAAPRISLRRKEGVLDGHGHRKGTGNCHLQAQIPKFKTQGLQGDADDPMTPEPV